MRLIALLTSIAVAAIFPALAHAQNYPGRMIRMIVPFPAGGATDIIARLVAQKLGETFGQQVIVDNRGGAAGTIGSDLVAKAPADGYTILIGTALSFLPYIQSGRLKALAVTSLRRSVVMPEVPTVAESGLKGFEALQWFGVFAPAGTRADVIERLNGEIVKILHTGDMRERLTKLGCDVRADTPDEFAAFQKADIAKWANVVKDSGAHID